MDKTRNLQPNLWNGIILFAVIYFSKDTLLFGTNADARYEMVLYASLPVIMLCVFAIGCYRKSVISASACVASIAYCCLSIITMILTDHSSGNLKYIYECMMIFAAFFICTVVPVWEFKHHFVNIMSFLALISVTAFALRYLFPGINGVLPVIVNTNGYSYSNLWLAVIPHDVEYVAFRNQSIFREPGMFQGFLNLALLFYFDSKENQRAWKLCSLLLALVFTFSTAGYLICAAIALVQMFLRRLKLNVRTVLLLAVGAAVILPMLRSGTIEYDSAVFNKLTMENSSANSRFGSILVDAYIGLRSPLWGNGFDYVERYFGRIARDVFSLTQMSNTNTVMKMFAVHGIGIMLLFLAGIIRFCKAHVGKKEWLCHALIMGLILSNEDLMFNTCIYIIMLYGFAGGQGVINENKTGTNQCGSLREYRADHVSPGGPGGR